MRGGDTVRSSRGPDAREGARVRVVGAEGSCLKVAGSGAIEGPGG